MQAVCPRLPANEELRSATEEYQSVNEELQSSNEELETSKEEMQSINEELQTVNAEVMGKNTLLGHANSDLKNLLDSTEVATIFLDNNLLIKNFTPGMTAIFHLRDTDRGRPITEIVSQLRYDELKQDVRKVLGNLSVVERELQLLDKGMTFIMRMRPYRTIDNVIDGVVITFLDIAERKKAEEIQNLLMGELDHRVKNILALVSAVVAQTMRRARSPEELATALEGRIAAIARAHDLLRNSGGHEALLRELIAAELTPYERHEPRTALEGPAIVLNPKAGLTFCMMFHELASNSVKFGALSTPEGRVAVEWSLAGSAPVPTLRLVWSESSGPPVRAPERKGFGTLMIERILAQELDGMAKREFLSSGFRCTVDIPFTTAVGHLRPDRQ